MAPGRTILTDGRGTPIMGAPWAAEVALTTGVTCGAMLRRTSEYMTGGTPCGTPGTRLAPCRELGFRNDCNRRK